MNVSEFLIAKRMTMFALARLSRVPYASISNHVRHGRAIGVKCAKRLQTATDGEISAAEVLGVEPVATARTKRRSKKAA